MTAQMHLHPSRELSRLQQQHPCYSTGCKVWRLQDALLLASVVCQAE